MAFAVLFPGQGAQQVGMGRALFEQSEAARVVFEAAEACLGLPLSRLCFEGPEKELNRTDISQPALLCVSIAALEAFKETGADLMTGCLGTAGLSLGEYTALVFAGVIDFEDGLRLVRARGEFMQEACDATPSGMTSLVGIDRADAEALCRDAAGDEVLQVANLNAPGQVVVSGALGALERVTALAKERKLRAMPLAVAGAFHSELMRPARERLAEHIGGLLFRAPSVPVFSNVNAAAERDPARLQQLLVEQLTSPVLWVDSMRALLATGVTRCYEVGCGQVLSGLMKRIARDCERVVIGTPEDIALARATRLVV